jgi:hypothetical protein
MPRKIFGPKIDEVTGGWRKLHNEELHNLYSSSRIIRVIKSRRAYSTNGGEDECIKDIGGKARRKESVGRPRPKWVDNIKMDLREMGWYGLDRASSG